MSKPDTNRLLARLLERLDARNPLVFAHRGDSYHAPENTILAAWLGLQAGAVAWEFDVRLSRDGVPVVIHDRSLLRTTDVAARFSDDPREVHGFPVELMDWDELRQLDAGTWFLGANGGSRSAAGFGTSGQIDPSVRPGIASGHVRIPSLAEALAFTIEHNWLANVEIKSAHDGNLGLIRATLRIVQEYECADCVLISSFDHAEVEHAAHIEPRVATGVLVTSPLAHPARYVREIVGADAYHVSADCLGLGGTPYRFEPSASAVRHAVVKECRRAGMPVSVYTVNKAQEASHLATSGVAGLFTDNPYDLINDNSSMRSKHLKPPGSCWAS